MATELEFLGRDGTEQLVATVKNQLRTKQDKSNYAYVNCTTADGTAAKTASITDAFSLATGTRVTVKFTYANTASSPTLNINGTGDKPIYWRDSGILPQQHWQAGAVLDFIYDGSHWVIIGSPKGTNTIYTLKASDDGAGNVVLSLSGLDTYH